MLISLCTFDQTEQKVRLSKTRRTKTTTNAPHWPTLALTALGLLIGPAMAHAAGFGPLRVQSNLGQPLQAEIDITGVTADEAQNLAVRLASADAYRAAGLTYHPIVGNLRVQLERRASGSYVAYVRSAQPVNEPFVDILVDMSWASGRVSRAYTFLLDPAGSKAPAPAVTSSAVAPGVMAPVLPDSARRSAPAPQAAPRPARATTGSTARQAAAAGGSYTVQRGDSLYSIAADAAQTQDAVSLDQMLLSLYRNNPSAFIGGNINRLKAGAVLKIPSTTQAREVPASTARREVIAHTQGFGGYRERLASSATPSADSETARQRSGRVTARVQDQAVPGGGARDELTLSRAERDGRNSLAAVNEELIAKDRALREAQERLAQLEKNLADLQRLVTLKNGEAPPGTAGATTQRGAAPADAGALTVPAVPAAAASAVAAAPVAAAQASVAAAASEAQAGAAPASETAAPAPAIAPAPAVPAPAATPVPAQPAEPGFFASLMNNPLMLAAIAALLALVGAFVWLRRRRAEGADAQGGFEDSLLSQESTVMGGANSLFGAPGGQSVDTSQHSVFGSDFRLASTTAEANEVDPVAEADVYIAYGRDIQAEEILREALERQPERQAVRLKLLEIYANRQDVAGFNAQAEVMHAQTKGIGPEWAQAAALGLKLEPANPLYAAGGGVIGTAGAGAVAYTGGVDRVDAGDDTAMRLDGDEWLTADPALDAHTKPLALGDLELPLDAFPASQLGASPSMSSASDDTPGGLPPVRLDAGDMTLPVNPETRPLDIDLSGISLDLSDDLPTSSTSRLGEGAAQGSTVHMTDESLGPLTLPSDTGTGASQELHIKFDLAKAYVEIGDKEGARELLQEVIGQADGALRAEAEGLLAQLG